MNDIELRETLRKELKKMKEGRAKIKFDHSGESQIFHIKGEDIFFTKSGKEITLKTADSGEPVFSGTNQYLKFSKDNEAQAWLDKNLK